MAANMRFRVSKCLFATVYMLISASLANAESLNVGVVIDPTTRIGKEQKIAMEIAAAYFNRTISKHNVELFLHFRSSNASNPLQAAYSAIELIKEKKVEVIIGSQTWQETTLLGEIATKHKVPILSLATPPVKPRGATVDQWPFLATMNRNYFGQIECIASLIKFHGWRRVVTVYENDGYDVSGTSVMLDLFSKALQDAGSEIEYHLALPPYASMSNPKEVISKELVKVLGTQSRVFVVLYSSLPVAIHLFREANDMGLVGRETAWIITDSIATFLDYMNASVLSSMEGTLGVKSYYDECTPKFKDFYSRFLLNFLLQYPQDENFVPSIHALKAYDAIKTVTMASGKMRGTINFMNKFIQVLSSLQFSGLSGQVYLKNGELEDKRGLLRIVNVVGKKYKELDFWSITKKGFFKKLSDQGEAVYSSSEVFHGSVNWPGDLKHVPKGWGMPTNAKPLKIGVPYRTVFDKFVKVEIGGNPNKTIYSGFCIDVFLEVVKILEESYAFPYEFEAFNGTYDELVESVHSKTYDAVVGDIAILANRSQHVEFTQPYARSGLSMIVPLKSHESHKAWMFMKPFSWKLWLASVGTLFYTMIIVFSVERRNNPDFGGSLNAQLSTVLWFTFTSLFFAHREKIQSNYARITVVTWLLVVFVLTSSYTASLTSILTVPLLEPKARDIKWLIKTNAKVGCDGNSFVLGYLQSVLNFPPQNIININSKYAYPDLLSNGSVAAAFIEHPYAKVFLRQYCKSFTQTKDNFRLGGLGFIFQKGSPLVADVSKAILKLSEKGILKQLNDKWFYPSSDCLSSSNANNANESLGIKVFWVLYLFSGVISTVCFLLFVTRSLKFLMEWKISTEIGLLLQRDLFL